MLSTDSVSTRRTHATNRPYSTRCTGVHGCPNERCDASEPRDVYRTGHRRLGNCFACRSARKGDDRRAQPRARERAGNARVAPRGERAGARRADAPGAFVQREHRGERNRRRLRHREPARGHARASVARDPRPARSRVPPARRRLRGCNINHGTRVVCSGNDARRRAPHGREREASGGDCPPALPTGICARGPSRERAHRCCAARRCAGDPRGRARNRRARPLTRADRGDRRAPHARRPARRAVAEIIPEGALRDSRRASAVDHCNTERLHRDQGGDRRARHGGRNAAACAVRHRGAARLEARAARGRASARFASPRTARGRLRQRSRALRAARGRDSRQNARRATGLADVRRALHAGLPHPHA